MANKRTIDVEENMCSKKIRLSEQNNDAPACKKFKFELVKSLANSFNLVELSRLKDLNSTLKSVLKRFNTAPTHLHGQWYGCMFNILLKEQLFHCIMEYKDKYNHLNMLCFQDFLQQLDLEMRWMQNKNYDKFESNAIITLRQKLGTTRYIKKPILSIDVLKKTIDQFDYKTIHLENAVTSTWTIVALVSTCGVFFNEVLTTESGSIENICAWNMFFTSIVSFYKQSCFRYECYTFDKSIEFTAFDKFYSMVDNRCIENMTLKKCLFIEEILKIFTTKDEVYRALSKYERLFYSNVYYMNENKALIFNESDLKHCNNVKELSVLLKLTDYQECNHYYYDNFLNGNTTDLDLFVTYGKYCFKNYSSTIENNSMLNEFSNFFTKKTTLTPMSNIFAELFESEYKEHIDEKINKLLDKHINAGNYDLLNSMIKDLEEEDY